MCSSQVPNCKNKLHPTQKPIELTNILIENSSNPNDIVFDPFMGVGGCGQSCKQLSRRFIGIELDKNYFELAKNNIN